MGLKRYNPYERNCLTMINQQPLAKVKGVADLVILVDATGSMRPCIDSIKNSLMAFIREMTTGGQSPIANWRGRVIGFRDHLTDGDQWIVDNPFVSNDSEALLAQVNSVKTKLGGGDGPESLLEALEMILSWRVSEKGRDANPNEWRATSDAKRIVLLFTDAGYHESNLVQSPNTPSQVGAIVTRLNQMKIELVYVSPDTEQYDYFESADRSFWTLKLSRPFAKSLKDIATDNATFGRVMQAMAKTITREA